MFAGRAPPVPSADSTGFVGSAQEAVQSNPEGSRMTTIRRQSEDELQVDIDGLDVWITRNDDGQRVVSILTEDLREERDQQDGRAIMQVTLNGVDLYDHEGVSHV